MSTRKWELISDETITFARNLAASFVWVLMGMIGMTGEHMRKGKPVRNWKFLGQLMVSLVIGTLVGKYCMVKSPEWTPLAASLSAFFSDKIYLKLAKIIDRLKEPDS